MRHSVLDTTLEGCCTLLKPAVGHKSDAVPEDARPWATAPAEGHECDAHVTRAEPNPIACTPPTEPGAGRAPPGTPRRALGAQHRARRAQRSPKRRRSCEARLTAHSTREAEHRRVASQEHVVLSACAHARASACHVSSHNLQIQNSGNLRNSGERTSDPWGEVRVRLLPKETAPTTFKSLRPFAILQLSANLFSKRLQLKAARCEELYSGNAEASIAMMGFR